MRLTTEEKVIVRVIPRTASGKEATIDGAVTFESSDDSIATIEIIDENSCWVIGMSEGVAQIVATFDADLDEDETRTISASGVVEIVDAEASTAEIVFGIPEFQGVA